ncbi:hypothetical protein LTR97_006893 [Elasticomyces elasticus]|uniref:Uncharacterized protein n=1 Tax=Elasticomyces elasticus TaxID=574655 RepID=A0AAN8A0B2_9PEZI|nr:hypothetical protein LTR97_006893 [Elasticomyces elasticus]
MPSNPPMSDPALHLPDANAYEDATPTPLISLRPSDADWEGVKGVAEEDQKEKDDEYVVGGERLQW